MLEWALREAGSGLAVLACGSRDGLERLARGEAAMAGIRVTYNGQAPAPRGAGAPT